MLVDYRRRDFLRGKIKPQAVPLRPPWSIGELDFLEACTRCGECLEHCPEKVLFPDSDRGYPHINFTVGECSFCGRCVDICPTGALTRMLAPPWTAKARVTAGCLAARQVVCLTCGELCETEAIRFDTQAGNVARPVIDSGRCTGCGACVAPCPTKSIEVVRE